MNRSRRATPVCAVVIALLAAPAAQATERRVLLLNEARGFVHESIPAATALFTGLGERSSTYDVVRLSGGAAQLTAPGSIVCTGE